MISQSLRLKVLSFFRFKAFTLVWFVDQSQTKKALIQCNIRTFTLVEDLNTLKMKESQQLH